MFRPMMLIFFLASCGGIALSAPPGGSRCESPTCRCADCDSHCRCCFRSESAEAFQPGGPISPDGKKATVDLPTNRHIRNVGGSDGAGLCVFTSIQMAADWQNVRELDGFREWMRRRPGGGWPEKVDQMLKQFCGEKGVPVPPYVQHTGGDEAFLALALKSRRAVCVTYAGRDDFYRGPIAHMVDLVYLDDAAAAIIDNNRPGVWVWMTRAEFLQRWRAMQGGWAMVLLSPPPPPHKATAPAWRIPVGQCPGGSCGGGGCSGGFCPLPMMRIPAPAPIPEPEAAYEWDQSRFDSDGPYFVLRKGKRVIGAWYGGGFHRQIAGRPDGVFEAEKSASPVNPPREAESVAAADVQNFGVVPSKIHAGKRWYSLNGIEVPRNEALDAFGDDLPADSDRFYLTIVGDAAFIAKAKAEVAKLPDQDRGRLHVQTYSPDHWAVAHFGLAPGLTIRKPTSGDSSAEVGTITPAGFTPDELLALIDLALRLKPKPQPKPPEPNPAPKPGPAPSPDGPTCPLRKFAPWLFVAALGLRSLFSKKG